MSQQYCPQRHVSGVIAGKSVRESSLSVEIQTHYILTAVRYVSGVCEILLCLKSSES